MARNRLESLHTSTVVEIWDYLRDVLILILTGHYVGDEAPLGFLVAPTLCEALLALLRQTGHPLGNVLDSLVKSIHPIKVTWALYSPWAKILYKELGVLLQEDGHSLSKIHVVLKTQLMMTGKKLMQIVRD